MVYSSESAGWHHPYQHARFLHKLGYTHIHTSGLTQSDGIVSHVCSWTFCMTLHHMCNLHTSAGVTIKVVHWAWRVHESHIPLLSATHSCHQFCFSLCLCLCARACIWHLSSGLRVMPWSCRKLGHRSMYAMRCPVWETASLHVSLTRMTGNNAATGFFLLTLICPQNQQAVILPFAAWM